jgi:DNA-binding HxlR family transcriptional regulator
MTSTILDLANDVKNENNGGRMNTAELLIHPVRIRILQALLGDRELTTADLRRLLPDVSAATLYRQVATLLEASVLEVTDERKVRGTFERTYRLRPAALVVDAADAAAMTAEQHAQAFTTFVAGLLGDFDRYLARGDTDLQRDNVGYRHLALYLSDREVAEFITELGEVVRPRAELRPGPGRTRRMFSTVLMPAD